MASDIFNFTNGAKRRAANQGATFERTFLYTDDDGTTIDLTGYTGQFTVRKTAFDKTAYEGVVVITGAQGQIDITLSATITASMPADIYVYEFRLTKPDNTVLVLLEGQFEVIAGVAR